MCGRPIPINDTATLEQSAVLAAGLTAVMWGLTGILVRLLPPVSPLAVTADRLITALVVALPPFAISRSKRSSLQKDLKKPTGYVLAFLLTGYYLLATAAFQLAPVAEVALLLSTPPLFVLALRRIRGEAPTFLEMLGAGLAVVGIAVILGPRLTLGDRFTPHGLAGDVLAICAAVLAAFYVYLYREVANQRMAPEPVNVTLMTFALGSIVLIPIVPAVPTAISWRTLSSNNLLVLVGLGVFCTAMPSFVFAFAAQRLPSVVTATISLLIPLFAAAFAFVIIGEKVPPTTIPGSVLVIVGIVIILRQTSQSIRRNGKTVHK